MTVGIYRIYNKITGRSYVGQSSNIENRIKQHFSKIRSSFPTGADKRMKEDYEKYGMESFAYEVLEECSPDDLDDREGYWAYQFKVFDPDKGYNIDRWRMTSYDKYKWMYTPIEERQRIHEKIMFDVYYYSALGINKNPEDPQTFYEYIMKRWNEDPHFISWVKETYKILQKHGLNLPLDQEKLESLAEWIEEYKRRKDELLKLKRKIDNEIAEAIGIKIN